jgi:uncharacterized membrane protein
VSAPTATAVPSRGLRLSALLPRTRVQWIVAAVFVVLLGWYLAFAVQRYETSHLYGDEPEYLFTGESVWNDGDLDLRNQFLNPERHSFPGPLTFRVAPGGAPSPANFMPTNGVVLSGPVEQAFGYLGVLVFYALLNVAMLMLLHLVLRRTFGDLPSIAAVGIVALSVPLAWHAASIWTEIPVTLGVCGVLALAPRMHRSKGALVGAVLILGALPWFHQKYLPLVAGLGAALLIDRARRRLWPWIAGGVALLGFGGTAVFSLALRDRINFTQSGATAEISSAFDHSIERFLAQPFAWFFDQTRGYLPLAPIWILVPVGALFLLRTARGRRLVAFLLVAFTPFLVIYFAGPFLAGDAPPGRETLPAIPGLAILLAAGLAAIRGPVVVGATAVLATISAAIGTIPAFTPGMDIFFNNAGHPKLLNTLSSERWNWAELWPRITEEKGYWQGGRLLVMVLLAGLAVVWMHLASRRPGADAWRPGDAGPDVTAAEV